VSQEPPINLISPISNCQAPQTASGAVFPDVKSSIPTIHPEFLSLTSKIVEHSPYLPEYSPDGW
jgi:hypothetical protein